MTYSESAQGVGISRERARQELATHGMGPVEWGEMLEELGDRETYDTGDVRNGPVWFFHHDYSRAHNGVDTVTAFRVWTTSREANR